MHSANMLHQCYRGVTGLLCTCLSVHSGPMSLLTFFISSITSPLALLSERREVRMGRREARGGQEVRGDGREARGEGQEGGERREGGEREARGDREMRGER
jgi:hypothetical protein